MTADRPGTTSSEMVLVFAPIGRDGAVIGELLAGGGVSSKTYREMAELASEFSLEGAGALMLTEEALTREALQRLSTLLREQSSWSDIPIIVLAAAPGANDAMARIFRTLEPAGTVTVLERPVRKLTLMTAVRTALRARRRQYEARRLLAQLEAQTSQLMTEKAARERFVSVLAHDLRGPLAAARMGIHLLLLPEQQKQERRFDLKLKVDRNLDRIEMMIRDLLDANRIQAGERLPLRIDECDAVGVCREVIEDLGMADQREIELTGPEQLLGHWSAEELRRSIWNLVSNAIKYGDKRAPVVVGVRPDADSVEIAVHNEGPAIPAEDLPLLFEPFRRTRHGHAAAEKGWGLGLTLVRGCAEAHGGTARVESDAQRGTTFTLLLPRDARPFQPSAARQPQEMH